MKNPDDSYLKGRFRSFKFAFRGAWYLLTTEHSIMAHFGIAVFMTILGFIMKLSATEWIMQFFAIGFLMVSEALNTGIEKLADYVQPSFDKKIGFIKDISAGAVAFAMIIAIIIGLIIYIPKFS
jgi:diacylglycerol kinase (ATP)